MRFTISQATANMIMDAIYYVLHDVVDDLSIYGNDEQELCEWIRNEFTDFCSCAGIVIEEEGEAI